MLRRVISLYRDAYAGLPRNAWLLSLLQVKESLSPVPPPGHRHHLPAIFFLVFGIGLIFSQLFSTYPLYIHQVFGFAENRIGQLLAINTLMIVLFEMVLLQKLKGIKPLKIIAVGAGLTGLGFALMPLALWLGCGALGILLALGFYRLAGRQTGSQGTGPEVLQAD